MNEIISTEDAMNAINYILNNDVVRIFNGLFYIIGCGMGVLSFVFVETIVEVIDYKRQKRKERGEK